MAILASPCYEEGATEAAMEQHNDESSWLTFRGSIVRDSRLRVGSGDLACPCLGSVSESRPLSRGRRFEWWREIFQARLATSIQRRRSFRASDGVAATVGRGGAVGAAGFARQAAGGRQTYTNKTLPADDLANRLLLCLHRAALGNHRLQCSCAKWWDPAAVMWGHTVVQWVSLVLRGTHAASCRVPDRHCWSVLFGHHRRIDFFHRPMEWCTCSPSSCTSFNHYVALSLGSWKACSSTTWTHLPLLYYPCYNGLCLSSADPPSSSASYLAIQSSAAFHGFPSTPLLRRYASTISLVIRDVFSRSWKPIYTSAQSSEALPHRRLAGSEQPGTSTELLLALDVVVVECFKDL